MQLALLGTGGYHPSDTRQTACLMIPSLGVVLDAGTAMYRIRQHLQTDELQIFLTHAHLDHVVGLTYLLSILHERDVRRVVVHAEAGKLEAIDRHLFATDMFPVKVSMVTKALDGSPVALPGGGTLRSFPLEHPGGAVGFRLDWPERSLAYVTDTTARRDAPYVEQIRGVDLLVHECYFPDELADLAELTGHSCLTAVTEVALAAEAGRLILTHFHPFEATDAALDIDAARRRFPQLLRGHDGLIVDF